MKRIFHVGAWNRNYGDYALQAGLHASLRRLSDSSLDFVPVDCQRTRFHPDLVDLINETGDMLLVGGGGLIFNRPEDKSVSGWQFNIDHGQLARLKVPLVIYAIGYNRFPYDSSDFPPQLDDHLKATQQAAALFSVRNEGTRQELLRRGLTNEALEVIPDPGMFVPSRVPTLPRIADRTYLIGINWAGDRPAHRYPAPAKAHEESAATVVAEALGEHLDRRAPDGRVVLIPHLMEIDSAIGPVFRRVLGDRFYDLEAEMPEIYPPSYAQVPLFAGVYRRMNVVLGMRGHANIVPFGLGTPFIGVGTHNKNRFFAAEVGLEAHFVALDDISAPDELKRGILELLRADEGEVRTTLASTLEDQRAIADQYNRKVLNLLE